MNSGEFRMAIARAGTSNREVAANLGLSEQAFYNKINGRTEFKNSEIVKLTKLLRLSMDAVNIIFFDGNVN